MPTTQTTTTTPTETEQDIRTAKEMTFMDTKQIKALITDLMSARDDAFSAARFADNALHEAQKAKRDSENALAKITMAIESLKLAL